MQKIAGEESKDPLTHHPAGDIGVLTAGTMMASDIF